MSAAPPPGPRREIERDVARRGQRFAAAIPGDPEDSTSWRTITDRYLLSLELSDHSNATVYARRRAIARFAVWNLVNHTNSPLAVDDDVIDAYRLYLHCHLTSRGARLSIRTRQQYLIAIRGLYRWLHTTKQIAHDPTALIELPSTPQQLPRNYLTANQAERVLTEPDLTTPLGRRDRTMLEVLYATGIRRSELANLHTDDVDLDDHTLFVNQGKGRRDRLVPTGTRAADWLADYLTTSRPLLVNNRPDPDTLFVTRHATPICTAHIGKIIGTYLRRSGLARGNCHTFRHTTATLMLRNGADLRSIQTMLGHANLASTERYTHITIDHLTDVHARTHPSATADATSARP